MKHRGVEDFKISLGGWKGWSWFKSKVDLCDYDQMKILVGLLKTGSRSNELNQLTKSMVDVDSYKDWIVIKRQPLEKQKRAIQLIGEDGTPMYDGMKRLYKFEHIEGWRTYAFKKNEMYSNVFLEMVNEAEKPTDLVFPYSYSQIYYRICTIGVTLPEGVPKKKWAYHLGELFPHEIRSIRACQLLRERKYNTMQLCKFFGWSKDSPMPTHYTELTVDDLMN